MASMLQKVLKPEAIRIRLQATNKQEAIRELVDILDQAEHLKDRAEAERVLFARERSLSTGLQDGIAIPHGKTDTVDHLVVAIGIRKDGIDFDCADGKPARIFVLALSPASKAGPHIQFLAEISSILAKPEARQRLLSAASPQEVYSLLTLKKW